jgi:hypothetical protein
MRSFELDEAGKTAFGNAGACEAIVKALAFYADDADPVYSSLVN